MKKVPVTSTLRDIYDKVLAGKRLNREDGVRLYESNDLLLIGHMANIVRERKNGDKTFYIINRHINYSNICKNQCRFCAFSKEEGDEGSYAMTLDEVIEEAEGVVDQGATEIHIVGGLHPKLPFDYYLEMLGRLHQRYPQVHLQAFTAVEIAHLAGEAGLSIRDALLACR